MAKTEENKKKLYPSYNRSVDDIGKIQPQAIDLEEVVLGAMLLESDSVHPILDILYPESFYKEQNGKVFRAIVSLVNRPEPVDILTVTQELKRTGELEFVGGAYYVSSLTNRIASSANIEFHARVIAQKYLQRELIRISTETIKNAYEDSADAFDLIENYEKNLTKLTSQIVISKGHTSESLFNKMLEEDKILASRTGDLVGVPSGFVDIDSHTGGWQKTDVVIVAARPGMGKTAFMLCTARNAVKKGFPVGIFSLEMSALQLYKRLSSQETDIPHEILKKGMDSDTRKIFIRDMQSLRMAPILIDDTGGLSLFELRQKARKMKRENDVQLIIIDYLQLMSGSNERGGNREQELSNISRGIKTLAKELEIPIIALSQLSRQVENRPGGNKRPQLSDLRESGAIEQDADMVMFIYRPEYYGIEFDEQNNSTREVADIIIAKNRHGSLETIDLRWLADRTKFVDWNSKPESFESSMPNNIDFLQS